MTLEKSLNRIIRMNLYGPSTDPDEINLQTAAIAYLELVGHNLLVKGEPEIKRVLEGENINEKNYLL